MSEQNTNDTMIELFVFESSQQIEQIEQLILNSDDHYTEETINESFRIMHTIKGSASMMMFHEIANLAHTIEDLFFYLREENPNEVNYGSLTDLILDSIDFIKVEITKIKNKDCVDGNSNELMSHLKQFLVDLKKDNSNNLINCEQEEYDNYNQFFVNNSKTDWSKYCNTYKAVIFFEEGCEMENVRAYAIIHKLKDITDCYAYYPGDILDSDKSVESIRREGFKIFLKVNCIYDDMQEFFMQTIFLKSLELVQLKEDVFSKKFLYTEQASTKKTSKELKKYKDNKSYTSKRNSISSKQSIISVSVDKLDKLMDLVGEMVISESMVVQNPDLQGLELNNFQKAARQLNKITTEIQDTVMDIRMVPISATFHKMNRIVRDMCRNLDKEVELVIEGEDTEVDKNIIEHISDPLMHLVRNAIDHGIEALDVRQEKGKQRKGTINLKAENKGNDVLIIVSDDGKGLNKENILKNAIKHNIISKNEVNMTDEKIFNLILYPGFSTNKNVTEYSGRGVGMDVVTKNIESIGGTVSIESAVDKGTTFILKIPLTLAIIDGMNIKVGSSLFTIATTAIKEFFQPRIEDIIINPDDKEMIMVRGSCYPILRLNKLYNLDSHNKNFADGIIIMVQQDDNTVCIFADELLGQQQVVVKSLPEYIKQLKEIGGLAGCTLLGNGDISLILDVTGLINVIY